MRELHEVLRAADDVRADVKQKQWADTRARDRQRQRRAVDPAVALEVEEAGGKGRAGRAAGDERLRATFGDLGAVLDDLPDNPLRDAYELPALQVSGGRLAELGRSLKGQPCVADVDFGAEWLEPAQRLLGGLRWALGALFGLIAGVTLVLVANTFQLAIYARREEIGILKLVGATDGFVRWPFLLEGLLEGLIGGALAGGAVAGGLAALWPRALVLVPLLASLGTHPLPLLQLALSLVGIGAGIGFFASGFAVGRFLRV